MGKTIRVRIAVAIDSGGEWNANGWGGAGEPYSPQAEAMAREAVGGDAAVHWIEADLPVPDARGRARGLRGADGAGTTLEASPRNDMLWRRTLRVLLRRHPAPWVNLAGAVLSTLGGIGIGLDHGLGWGLASGVAFAIGIDAVAHWLFRPE